MRQSRLHQQRKRLIMTTALLQTWFYSLDSACVTPHKSTSSMASSVVSLVFYSAPRKKRSACPSSNTSFLRVFTREDHALRSFYIFLFLSHTKQRESIIYRVSIVHTAPSGLSVLQKLQGWPAGCGRAVAQQDPSVVPLGVYVYCTHAVQNEEKCLEIK